MATYQIEVQLAPDTPVVYEGNTPTFYIAADDIEAAMEQAALMYILRQGEQFVYVKTRRGLSESPEEDSDG